MRGASQLPKRWTGVIAPASVNRGVRTPSTRSHSPRAIGARSFGASWGSSLPSASRNRTTLAPIARARSTPARQADP